MKIPAGAAVIGLSRSTVLPGLFACHEQMAFLIEQRGGRELFLTALVRLTPSDWRYRGGARVLWQLGGGLRPAS